MPMASGDQVYRVWGMVLPNKKCRSAEKHQAAQWPAAEWANFKDSGEHITGKHAAWGVDAAVFSGVAGADVGIDFVVRRSKIELRPAPESVARKEHAFLAGWGWRIG